MVGREPRRIVWDDEAGTVDGDHSDVPFLRVVLAGPFPHVSGCEAGSLTLRDLAHDAADFLGAVARYVDMNVADQPPLPPALRDVVPTPPAAWPPPPPGSVH